MFETNAVRNEYGVAVEIKNLQKTSRKIPRNEEALLTSDRERKSIPITMLTGERKLLMAVKGDKHITVFPRKTTSPGTGKPLLGEFNYSLENLEIIRNLAKEKGSNNSTLVI
jgi:hypothetical protein